MVGFQIPTVPDLLGIQMVTVSWNWSLFLQIIVESLANQVPARRGESASRRSRKVSEISQQSSQKTGQGSNSSQQHDKDSGHRIQVRALVEGRRSMSDENTIG